MKLAELFKSISKWAWQPTLDNYNSEIKSLEKSNKNLQLSLKNHLEIQELLQDDIEELQLEIEELENDGWFNPYGWNNYTGKYYNLGNHNIPPNGFIIINDKNIVQQAQKLKGADILETAKNIERWLYSNIIYTSDNANKLYNGQIEVFIPANITLATKRGDCEDYANLFQSMMHILGCGKESVVCIAKNVKHLVKWYTGEYIGHGWNKVLIDGEWVDFDGNAGARNKKKCEYPKMKNCTYFYNYYGVFQGGD